MMNDKSDSSASRHPLLNKIAFTILIIAWFYVIIRVFLCCLCSIKDWDIKEEVENINNLFIGIAGSALCSFLLEGYEISQSNKKIKQHILSCKEGVRSQKEEISKLVWMFNEVIHPQDSSDSNEVDAYALFYFPAFSGNPAYTQYFRSRVQEQLDNACSLSKEMQMEIDSNASVAEEALGYKLPDIQLAIKTYTENLPEFTREMAYYESFPPLSPTEKATSLNKDFKTLLEYLDLIIE